MTPDRVTRVQVADDHPVVRTGVRLIVESAPDCEFLGETVDAATTFAAVEAHPPDVLVLDLWMGGNDGLDLIRRLCATHPQTRILIYSMADEQVFGPRALRAGAAGFLRKDRGLDELLQAIRTVAGGRRSISAALADELMEAGLRGVHSGETRPSELSALTDRELQVLRLIGRGVSSARIAETLNISPKTVGAHRENLKNKLRLADAAELAQRAASLLEHRLL
ncbi:MAG: response regulator transcription factor [Chthoniobacter sp.]